MFKRMPQSESESDLLLRHRHFYNNQKHLCEDEDGSTEDRPDAAGLRRDPPSPPRE